MPRARTQSQHRRGRHPGCRALLACRAGQSTEMTARPGLDCRLESTVAVNQRRAEGGQRGPATAASPGARGRDTLAEGVIQTLEQFPGTPVTHSELARSLRER